MTEVRVLSQVKQDVVDDRRYTARWIGLSSHDKSRITVNSALTSRNDKVDVYRFRVSYGGPLGFAVTADNNVRVELLNRNGRVIADNEGTADQQANYDLFLASRLSEISDGDHYIRISRAEGVAKDEAVEYFFQITNGAYTTDYDTIETPPPAVATNVNLKALSSTNVTNNLQDFISSSVLSDDNIFKQYQDIYGSIVDVNA
ncbi:MAG: hypothetical protein AB7G06_05030 [Bdellovibrionales bacterium]